jgi:ribosomal protein L34E
MKELGLSSIYHDLGRAAPLNESTKRYIVRCDKCTMEVLRKKKPAANLLCARCRKPLVAFEVVEVRPVELARAALGRRRGF